MAIETEKRARECSIGDYIERDDVRNGIIRGYVYENNYSSVYIVTDDWNGGEGNPTLLKDAKTKYKKKFSFYVFGDYYVKVLRKAKQLNDLSFYIEHLW